MILIESNFDIKPIVESTSDGGKKFYLEGVFAEANVKNRNGRVYRLEDMERAVAFINEQAALGRHVLGHLDHPNTLEVKLDEVSHKILSARLEGNQVICKSEILGRTDKGRIAIGLIEDGVQLGVSTRGSGRVNSRTNIVEDFNFITVDLVATPSCRAAYPQSVMEGLEMGLSYSELSELGFDAITESKEAQAYFKSELTDFIKSLGKPTK